jgi:6-phosphogluconolactonase (cycloisomerase 2 family)
MRVFLLAVALSLCPFIATAAHSGSRAEYVGGTRLDIPANNSGDIRITDEVYFVFVSNRTQVKVPYERINLLEYGQKVDRRYIAAVVLSPLFLLAKKRQHFLTVGFQDEEGRQQAMVFRVDKNDVRMTLVALEARTGQRIQYQDDEARMAGKG